ncbi:UNVERIFIED_CONTAM: putative mitochondrial protein [Sesamum latifolium]|uniref:Mitochondrial protein n=1 Tax=Sesamum latifolium TaxID=2727402 RepID=A0AAW2UII5_9LAMI
MEVMRLIKSKVPADPIQVNYAETDEYAVWQNSIIQADPYICALCSLFQIQSLTDQMTNEVVGVARKIGKLYVLENNSVIPTFINQFMSKHSSLVSHVVHVDEPKIFSQDQKCVEWQRAMKEEIEALEKNKAWYITPLPTGKRAIGSKWVFKLKLNPDGSVNRYKARLVAKGS